MAAWTDIPADVLAVLRRGTVLPAHPLAFVEGRRKLPGITLVERID
jgi:hypothetical protein